MSTSSQLPHVRSQSRTSLLKVLHLSGGVFDLLLTAAVALECVSDHGKQACSDLGGECVTERDGYYIVSAICLSLGVIGLFVHMIPTARKLQGTLLCCLPCSETSIDLSCDGSCAAEQMAGVVRGTTVGAGIAVMRIHTLAVLCRLDICSLVNQSIYAAEYRCASRRTPRIAGNPGNVPARLP